MRSALGTWVPAVLALLVALGAGSVIVGAPAGLPDPEAVALNATADDARPGSVEPLLGEDWGEGRLLVLRFEGPDGDRRLAIAFVIDHGRGWRLGGYTQQRAEVSDVRVGSLLVASSEGGKGQPPWTAAFGELSDDRVARVEIAWTGGTTTTATLRDRAYLAVRPDETTVEAVRYLAEDGAEIATVPV